MSAVLDDLPMIDPALIDRPAEVHDVAEIRDGKAIVAYSRTEAALADLRKRYTGATFDLTTTKGDQAARAARLELVTLRTSLEKRRKEFKAPALDFGKRIDDEARRITAAIVELEDPIDAQIKAREAELAAAKAERERIEAERKAVHERGLNVIRGYVQQAAGRSAPVLAVAIDALKAMVFGEAWQEYADKAAEARDETVAELRRMHATAVLAEQVEAQRVENERIAAEQAERQRLLDAQAAEIEAARQRAEAAGRSADLGMADTPAPGQREAAPNTTSGAAPQHASDQREPEADAAPGGDAGSVRVQACRPEDRAMLATPAGAELVQAVAEQLAEEEPSLLVGAIGTRLGFQLRAEFIEKQLGIKPAARRQSAVLWRESAWPQICSALVKHIEGLR